MTLWRKSTAIRRQTVNIKVSREKRNVAADFTRAAGNKSACVFVFAGALKVVLIVKQVKNKSLENPIELKIMINEG